MKKELETSSLTKLPLSRMTVFLTSDCIQQSLLMGLPADRYMQILIGSIKVFDKKTNCPAKMKLISRLNAAIGLFQKTYPDADISLFLEQIQSHTYNDHHDIVTSLLIRTGLNALTRQKSYEPAMQDFFNAAVDRLNFNFAGEEPLSHQVLILAALNNATQKNSDLITGDYFELCCRFIGIIYLSLSPSSHRWPAKRIEEEDEIITGAHRTALANLITVTEAHKNRHATLDKQYFPADDEVASLKFNIKHVFSGEGMGLLQSAMQITMLQEIHDGLNNLLGEIIKLRKYAEPTVSDCAHFKPSIFSLR